MKNFIRRFIESNIDVITKGDWKTFFNLYYMEKEGDWCFANEDEFEELMNVFKEAGVVVDMSAREPIILGWLEKLFEERLGDEDAPKDVGFYYFEEGLNTHLGYSVLEIDELIVKTAKDFGLTQITTGFTWE